MVSTSHLTCPFWLLRFIGISEHVGAIGVVLPVLVRVQPQLTPLAALGLTLIQLLAIGFHAVRGETAMTLPLNLVLLGLSPFVFWGGVARRQFRRAPPNSHHGNNEAMTGECASFTIPTLA